MAGPVDSHMFRLLRSITVCRRILKPSYLHGKRNPSTVWVNFSTYVLSKFGEIGLVEQVRDGATLRVRLFMSDGSHQMVNISLAGVKSPRASTRPGESSEAWGEEVGVLHLYYMTLSESLCKAKFFTESRLLQRPVRVVILSLPHAMANPFQSSASATTPPSASVFIGKGKCEF